MRPLQEHDPRRVGPYLLLGLLGAGGMGQVYLAAGSGGLVALKIVHPWVADDEEFRARFAREVAMSRRVRSRSTAAVVDADVNAPLPWLATEYVRGVPLDRAVRVAGPLPVPAAEVLAAGVARALATIHAAGLVHRDVKPANIVVAPDRPYLIDFGISRALDATQLTATGSAIGTPAFMSPEQAEGHEAGTASDVFSLGSVLVFAASGEGPYGAGTPLSVLARIRIGHPELGGLTGRLREIVARCLRQDPVERPTAAEIADALEPLPASVSEGWLPPAVTALIPPLPAVADHGPADTHRIPPQDTRQASTIVPTPAPTGPSTARPVRRLSRRALLVGASALGVVGTGAAVTAALNGAGPLGPTAPNEQPVLRWKFEPKFGPRGIAHSDGLLIVTTQNQVHGLDQDSGESRWSYSPDDYEVDDFGLTDGVLVTSGHVTEGHDSGLRALDVTSGALRWKGKDDAVVRVLGAGRGIFLAVVLHDSSGSNIGLGAFDVTTGRQLWVNPLPPSGYPGRAVVDAAGVHLIDHELVLVTLDPETGTEQRRWPLGEGITTDLDIRIADGVLYDGSYEDGGVPVVMAVDLATSTPRWRRPIEYPAKVSVDGGLLAVAQLGSLEAWDAATGDPRWVVEFGHDGGIRTAPVLAGGTCYIGESRPTTTVPDGWPTGAESQLHAFAADTGRLRWSFPISTALSGGEPILAVPGRAFLTGEYVVHAVSVN